MNDFDKRWINLANPIVQLICKNNILYDKYENTTWNNTASIVNGGVFGDQCIYISATNKNQGSPKQAIWCNNGSFLNLAIFNS